MDTSLMKILENFNKNVKEYGDKIAIKDGKNFFTYKQVEILSDIVCGNIKKYGLNKYAVCNDKTAELIITILGLWKAGCAYIPIDTDFPTERLEYILSNSKIKNIITSKKNNEKFSENYDVIYIEDLLAESEKVESSNNNDDVAYIIYTSGSTGKPKGVQISYTNLLNFFESIKTEIDINSNDVFLSITTISFDISIMEMFLPLMVGATVVIGSKRLLIDMKKLQTTLIDNDITAMQATPITWNMLLANGWKNSTNIKIFCGGEKMEKQLAQRLLNISNNVWNLYGPTEATIWSSIQKVENECDISIGRPLQGITYYVLDDNMNTTTEGELYIGGKCISKGYYNNQELTKERFIINPINGNELIYRTGDIVRYDNGNYYYIGRNDFQIKLNGHRIELEEIENCIKSISEVANAVVIPNQENKSIIAFVKLNEHIDNLQEYINDYLALKLPKYMIPHFVEEVNEFPTTFNNKIDRKTLLINYKNKDQKNSNLKENLIEIWKKYIKAEITEYTSFNDYNLDSLEFVRLCAEINNAGVNISLSELFEYKNINSILANLKNRENDNYAIDEKLFQKITEKMKIFNTDISNIKISELNEIENTMFMYYLFNRNSDIFYESYCYKIDTRLNDEEIIKAFYDAFSNIDSLKCLYFRGRDGKNVKAFSNNVQLVRTNLVEASSSEEYMVYIEKKKNEIYDINNKSIELNIIKFNAKKCIIINYHHIRMDGNEYYDCIQKFFDKVYGNLKSNDSHKVFYPNLNSILLCDNNTTELKKYCLKHNIRLGSLIQFVISNIMKEFAGYETYDIVVNNIPRKSSNDISIVNLKVSDNLFTHEEIINQTIAKMTQNNINRQKHEVLIIINNKQRIYELLKNNEIIEEHVEKNNYEYVFTIDIQDEIQITLNTKNNAGDLLEKVKNRMNKYKEER